MMVGSEELIARIRSEGDRRVAAINAERDRLVAAERERSAAEIAALEQATAERARHESEQIIERARSEARLLHRNAQQAARWCVFESVVDEAVGRFRQDPQYIKRLAELVKRNADDDSAVTVGKSDVAPLAKLGIEAGPGDMAGGAVISIGKRDLNFSLDALADELRGDIVGEIAAVLFPARD
jgi:vacuolar-type H+-ATPase subunit E/Vma4